MRYDNNIRYAIKMIAGYKGTVPLSAWLKEYFRQNKQMGSSDRKIISELMYCYYRLGLSSKHIPVEQKILAALFLCNKVSHPVLQHLRPGWDLFIGESLDQKIERLKIDAGIELEGKIFPFKNDLSEGMDGDAFELSFLVQPDLFIRIRPGKGEVVYRKLGDAKIIYKESGDHCLALPNGTKVDVILNLDQDAVVQDFNSQQTALYLKEGFSNQPPCTIWDCCAGSGGKSIMAQNLFSIAGTAVNNDHVFIPAQPGSPLGITVSDKRKIILDALKARFEKAGITQYNSFLADLSRKWEPPPAFPALFDLIICDAPCTGSGTWSRTPEQLHFFDRINIEKYSLLQKQILENIAPFMAPGGKLLYITCSVFRNENEEAVKFAKDYMGLHLNDSHLFTGYNMRADTMFAALFSKQ